jgi:hypothetical protein
MTDYKDLYESAMIGLWQAALTDGALLNGNEKTLEILGLFSPNELSNHKLKDFIGEEQQQSFFTQLKKLKEVHNQDITIKKLNGELTTVSISAKICPKKGWIEGTLEIPENHSSELQPYLEHINKINQNLRKRLISDEKNWAYSSLKIG